MTDHLQKVKDYLDGEKIKYQVIHHPARYTALELAEVQDIPGKEMVKSVIIRAGDSYVMCILPCIHNVDFERLAKVAGADLELATEDEVAYLFPECEIGAEPPFGNWHGLPIIADQALEDDDVIFFNAGTHTETVRMKWGDYKGLTHPRLAKIGVHI